ncbi:MAG: effector-associated domain EAD1-containing protein [Fischerella sp. CENA71]|nr:effector-associated domain EAD1-containing protein [Fischerella sp. CENA71]
MALSGQQRKDLLEALIDAFPNTASDLKKKFHATCALRGLKMSQVVAELIEQWLRANDSSASAKLKR